MQHVSILVNAGIVEYDEKRDKEGFGRVNLKRMYRPLSISRWVGAKIVGAKLIIDQGETLTVKSPGFFLVNAFVVCNRHGDHVYLGSPVGGKQGFLGEGRIDLSGVEINIENLGDAAGFDLTEEVNEREKDKRIWGS